jgi:hypothetical protein
MDFRRVAHQNINLPKARASFVYQMLECLALSHMSRNDDGFAGCVIRRFPLQRLMASATSWQCIRFATADHNFGALTCHFFRDSAPYSLTGTRNQCDLIR